jgi:hypothetical protein
MPSKEEIFKERFSAVVADTRDAATNPGDKQLLGSLAARLVDEARQPGWTRFKASLTRARYDGLLQSFQHQGNALARQGQVRQMRVVEVLASSLIARTQARDPEVEADDRALDALIEDAIRQFRDTQAADPLTS